MKKLTKNNLIIIAMICFAISAICSSMALSNSIRISEPFGNKIYFRLSSHLDLNNREILNALYKIDSGIEPILDTKIKIIEKYEDSIDTDIGRFNEEIEVLRNWVIISNFLSSLSFILGLFYSILAIKEK